MILLTSQFLENFENSRNENIMIQENYKKNSFDSCFDDENDCAKMYHEEYIEVFSPTVFETVEVYTSCSSEKSENSVDLTADQSVADVDSSGSTSDTILNKISLNSIDTVSSLGNLEPGTYTLDVLEPANFGFDAVLVDSTAASFALDLAAFGESSHATDEDDVCAHPDAEETGDGGVSKAAYKLKMYRNHSSRKPLSTKYPLKNVSVREFVNSFSSELRKNETSPSRSVGEDDAGRSLSWLLDFKISSIFHPVESDTLEKGKKKSNDTQRKPRYTYTELIEQALKENGELTVSGIYNWISNHYPYYQQHDDRWKNSVRHNLSINPQFRKGKKASQGAGHFWNISDSAIQCSELNNKERNRAETNSMTDLMSQIDEEVLAATRSIQETENLNFADVSLNEAVNHLSEVERKNMETSFVNITRTDIEQLWESTQDTSDQRFTSFSPLIGEITEEGGYDEESFLIQDIHNSICLGDELFGNGLSSPYHGLTTI